MPWRVTLTGTGSRAEHVYSVGLPLGTPDYIVYNAAAEQHNRLLHDPASTVDEGYRPPFSLTWDDTDKGD